MEEDKVMKIFKLIDHQEFEEATDLIPSDHRHLPISIRPLGNYVGDNCHLLHRAAMTDCKMLEWLLDGKADVNLKGEVSLLSLFSRIKLKNTNSTITLLCSVQSIVINKSVANCY